MQNDVLIGRDAVHPPRDGEARGLRCRLPEVLDNAAGTPALTMRAAALVIAAGRRRVGRAGQLAGGAWPRACIFFEMPSP
jgi:hypothetical protein